MRGEGKAKYFGVTIRMNGDPAPVGSVACRVAAYDPDGRGERTFYRALSYRVDDGAEVNARTAAREDWAVREALGATSTYEPDVVPTTREHYEAVQKRATDLIGEYEA